MIVGNKKGPCSMVFLCAVMVFTSTFSVIPFLFLSPKGQHPFWIIQIRGTLSGDL